MSLHVHCHISGGHFLLDLFARLRYFIFCKELPVVSSVNSHHDMNENWLNLSSDWSMNQSLKGYLVVELRAVACFRCWRLLFTVMGTYSTTTRNCRRHWFGYTFTQRFQNLTRWNVGVHWRMRLHPRVGPRRERTTGVWQCHSHAQKKIVSVAFPHWSWAQSRGLRKLPAILINLMMGGLRPNITCSASHTHTHGWLQIHIDLHFLYTYIIRGGKFEPPF